ncbi:MAG: hypothetical protein ACREUT_02575 [Steroidobacteraceae bacterium]
MPRRSRARLATIGLMVMLSLTGCASLGIDANGPAQIAQTYVGKPLADLEAQLGPPQRREVSEDEALSTWNFDRCSVTATSNRDGIVADVSWSRGCTAL